MNSHIKSYMAQSSLSPIDYTWMDLSNYHVSTEEWKNVLKIYGSFNETPNKDHPLPFERMAVITESPLTFHLTKNPSAIDSVTENVDGSLTLVTIVRDRNVIIYKLHVYIGPTDETPAVIGTVIDDFRNGDHKKVKGMTFQYEKKFRTMMNAYSFSDDLMNSIFTKHYLATVHKLYALTIKPDPIVTVCRPYGNVALNAKRRKKGKTQFWEWKTIEIKQTRTLPSAPQGGTHASPKPHERMGHWRAYKSGKRIFIKPHIVNKHKIPEEGYIFHDYTTRH